MDYGTIFKRLDAKLKLAMTASKDAYCNTPQFFEYSTLACHRAFEKICAESGVEPKLRSQFRELLKAHYKNGNVGWSTRFDNLFDYLPNEFNVRGKWTSEYA